MSRITHEKHPSELEMFGQELRGLPMRNAQDLDGNIGFPDPIDHQVFTALGGVILCGFSIGGGVIDQKHPAISIGDQKEPSDAWPINKDRISFVVLDQFSPVGSKVDIDIVLI